MRQIRPSLPDDQERAAEVRLHTSRLVRGLLAGGGLVALGLGILGVFLPVLPTTPFILLAAYCFARSSTRLHAALLRHKHFGPAIRNWQTNRCIARKTKRYALVMTALTFAVTVFMLDHLYGRIFLGAWGTGLLYYLAHIPACTAEK